MLPSLALRLSSFGDARAPAPGFAWQRPGHTFAADPELATLQEDDLPRMLQVLRFLFVIPIAFVAACLTSATAMLWPFLDGPGAIGATDPVYLFQLIVVFIEQAGQIGSVALLPWLVFMVITEAMAFRSILLHLAAGICGGAAILILAYGRAGPHPSVQTAIVVASIVFALVYWIVAGRAAGGWRRGTRGRKPVPPPLPAAISTRSD